MTPLVTPNDKEEELLRSVAIQNAQSILLARQRAEQELFAAQEALRQTAERLKLALAAGKLGDWSWEARSDLVSLGSSAANLFGLPPGEQITWAQMRGLLHEDDRERSRIAVERSLSERTNYDIEYRVNRPAGGQCWIAARGSGLYAEDGSVLGMIGVVQDITARKHADQDNARLYEAARKAAEELQVVLESEQSARTEAERMGAMKDEFLATLSHELRTPLGAILGWAQVLRRRTMDEADLHQGLDVIERNARIQTQLIEDLLDMSRITSGKVRLDIQRLEPVSFIQAALETVRPAAGAKGIRIEKVLDPAAGPISGDPHRLQQVIWNLLSNAIKFTPRDGKVQVVLERVSSHIEISVADTGAGIKPEFLDRVFDRFRQADASTTRRYGGLGLGLSIVKHLVELHGGTVRARSPGEGGGATFTVQLPLTVVHTEGDREREHPRTPAPVAAFKPSDLSGLKVLVVDDQVDARGLIRRVLEDCEAQVFTAGSVDEALRIFEAHKPDVLVSDIGMPDTDGFELLRRVRARGDKVPAIALTAFARSEDRTRALRAGFLVHVSKPVEPSELVATVASVAGRTG